MDGTVQCVDNSLHDDCERSLVFFSQMEVLILRFEQTSDYVLPDPRLGIALCDGSSKRPTGRSPVSSS